MVERDQTEDPCRGPVLDSRTRDRRRPRRALGPNPEDREQEEDRPAPEPEPEPAAVAPQCGRDRQAPPAATGEQIDDRCEVRQERGDEDELDGPPADDARAEIDVARGSLREVEPLVECIEDVLCRPAQLAEAQQIEPQGGV